MSRGAAEAGPGKGARFEPTGRPRKKPYYVGDLPVVLRAVSFLRAALDRNRGWAFTAQGDRVFVREVLDPAVLPEPPML